MPQKYKDFDQPGNTSFNDNSFLVNVFCNCTTVAFISGQGWNLPVLFRIGTASQGENQKFDDLQILHGSLGSLVVKSLYKRLPWIDHDMICYKVKFGCLWVYMCKLWESHLEIGKTYSEWPEWQKINGFFSASQLLYYHAGHTSWCYSIVIGEELAPEPTRTRTKHPLQTLRVLWLLNYWTTW